MKKAEQSCQHPVRFRAEGARIGAKGASASGSKHFVGSCKKAPKRTTVGKGAAVGGKEKKRCMEEDVVALINGENKGDILEKTTGPDWQSGDVFRPRARRG